ncbi:membrane bound O-acyl transferase family-domain-containing protein [Aspergillus karnatakaensis]|uniref:wax synthase family protein n=1 Tax=Aspergillus karnatakaensis TaxID=1810916 RepID=UPI003CCDCECF
MTLSALLPPIAAHIVLVSSVICLTPRQSLFRFAALPVLAWLTLQACNALDFFNHNQLVNPMTAGYFIVFAIHHAQLLFVTPIDKTDIDREISAKAKRNTGIVPRVKKALYLLSTPRGVETSFEIKGLQYSASALSSSRVRFLAWNILIIAIQYILIDLITHQPSSPEDIERFFSPGKEYLLFRPSNLPPPTLTEVGVHLGVALMAWGPMGSVFINIFYRVVAVLSVGLGISRPDQWPSLFGSITEAYTVRRFWGRYWHQLLRNPFQSITKFITQTILRLPQTGFTATFNRYLNVLLVFSCSALMHASIDAKGGIGFDRTGAWACFLLQPVGIVLEDLVCGFYTKLFGATQGKTPIWIRIIGYIWVWTFLTLVAPLYNFPLMRYQSPERNGVPFSIVKLLRGAVEG